MGVKSGLVALALSASLGSVPAIASPDVWSAIEAATQDANEEAFVYVPRTGTFEDIVEQSTAHQTTLRPYLDLVARENDFFEVHTHPREKKEPLAKAPAATREEAIKNALLRKIAEMGYDRDATLRRMTPSPDDIVAMVRQGAEFYRLRRGMHNDDEGLQRLSAAHPRFFVATRDEQDHPVMVEYAPSRRLDARMRRLVLVMDRPKRFEARLKTIGDRVARTYDELVTYARKHYDWQECHRYLNANSQVRLRVYRPEEEF